jgi:hypothetical protein
VGTLGRGGREVTLGRARTGNGTRFVRLERDATLARTQNARSLAICPWNRTWCCSACATEHAFCTLMMKSCSYGTTCRTPATTTYSRGPGGEARRPDASPSAFVSRDIVETGTGNEHPRAQECAAGRSRAQHEET